MIFLLPVHRVVVAVAITYAVLVLVCLSVQWHLADAPTLYASLKIALAGAFALNAALLGFIYFAWKWLWSKIPVLNTALFPNLNGLWQMKIHWIGKDDVKGVVDATATVKQDFVRISMEVSSRGSDSETMMARPKKDPESGRPLLYYVYRVVPKQINNEAGASYEGAAILKFDGTRGDSLSGNYFTSRQTRGHFTLLRSAPLKT